MEKGDKGSTLTRMGVSGWMFFLVPAYPGCPGQTAVKLLLLLLFSDESWLMAVHCQLNSKVPSLWKTSSFTTSLQRFFKYIALWESCFNHSWSQVAWLNKTKIIVISIARSSSVRILCLYIHTSVQLSEGKNLFQFILVLAFVVNIK